MLRFLRRTWLPTIGFVALTWIHRWDPGSGFILRYGLLITALIVVPSVWHLFVWRDGRLPDLPIEWAELALSLGVRDPDAAIAAQDVKDELRRNTDEAIARGVFGVPTLAIDGELFWGADATEMARGYAANGCRYSDPEYARIGALPVGVTRKPAAAKKG